MTENKTASFRLIHTDDYREGPVLCAVREDPIKDEEEEEKEEGSDEEQEDENEDSYHADIPITEKFVLYHAYLEFGETALTPLKEYNTKKEAEQAAKQQYTLYTGDYPFYYYRQ